MNENQKRAVIAYVALALLLVVYTKKLPDGARPVLPEPVTPGEIIVLFVYESDDLDNYTFDQRVAMDSGNVRDYLNSHNYEWRKFDQNKFDTVDKIPEELQKWADVMKGNRESLPWIYVSTGKAGIEGGFTDEAQVLTVLETWGGK